MKKLLSIILVGTIISSWTLAFATPSMHEVNNLIVQSNWQKAHSQLIQVLRAYPNSPYAHYLYGQVLAREGWASDALSELEKARMLDPKLRFSSSAEHFNAIEAYVQREAKRVVERNKLSLSTTPVQWHNPSINMWIVFISTLILVLLLVRRTVLRTRLNQNSLKQIHLQAQLKRSTELLNTARSLRLDMRLSMETGQESLLNEVSEIESRLCTLTNELANNHSLVSDNTLKHLESRLRNVRAHSEGQHDLNIATSHAISSTSNSLGKESVSTYAEEANRCSSYTQDSVARQSTQPQPTVIIQQSGGGGHGISNLLTGMLISQMFKDNPEQVIINNDRQCSHLDAPINPTLDIISHGNEDWSDATNVNIDVSSIDDDSNWT
ncbi:tetratricopeptide repeat protein [Candidatus Vallotia tarda]|uniref:Tetratricopeptide repeat family protein n=1 Tax=Candidatus Vallotiella hemipterorum TaxID=1177213 RepID=A0A916JTH6_9BURK|nr:tetratricopeptide repeat protein [Candidatus Vallotia tarda]CAG7601858.1 Tetratricopeptide repeat family protein [Candidatus Vallotia tarda]